MKSLHWPRAREIARLKYRMPCACALTRPPANPRRLRGVTEREGGREAARTLNSNIGNTPHVTYALAE